MEGMILILHVFSGLVALLAGFAVLALRKGTVRHKQFGKLFVVTMLGMGSTACLLGLLHASPNDVAGGLLVCYLVLSAWLAQRGKSGETGTGAYALLAFSTGITLYSLFSAILAGMADSGYYDGAPVSRHLAVALVLGLFMLGDIGHVLDKGRSARLRLFRHVWRSCLSLAGACGAFFLGQARFFPAVVRETELNLLLLVPPVLALLALLYWGARVLLNGTFITLRDPFPTVAGSLLLILATPLLHVPYETYAQHSNAVVVAVNMDNR